MPHTHPTQKPSPSDLVLVRIAVPSKMTTSTAADVFVRTCNEGVIRIPKTLTKEVKHKGLLKTEKSSVTLFEARVPRDVAAAVRSLYSELVRLTRPARK